MTDTGLTQTNFTIRGSQRPKRVALEVCEENALKMVVPGGFDTGGYRKY